MYRLCRVALIVATSAKQDAQIMIKSEKGGMHGATVTFSPFYDPEGKRLKS